MRILTFDEFFAEPDGVIFAQDTGLSHQVSGLYRKDRSFETDDTIGPSVRFTYLSDIGSSLWSCCFVCEESIEDNHRFHVYEAAELQKLIDYIKGAMP